ncbi:UDP-glycosyltransferase 76E2-like isoform X2 [Rhodamnia argentea]|uniref:UDP-glycosyltransferase 76E2-like isoform X2 n=1 Tax=Rhodamnia argentea TaxID=178133 RepID=A0ABM3HTV2_9MYRT|nr:UDP-glycosyltransferase 76E2-like isoform X2 [Rhodamnia argentea]
MEKMENEGRNLKRLVLVPGPFQGHLTPMLQLATILKSKDFSITIAHTLFNSPDSSAHPDFTFLCIPDGLSEQEVGNPDLVSIMRRVNDNCKFSFKECLIQGTNHTKLGDKICCIIYDAIVYFSEAVARDLKIPSIAFHTSSAATTAVRPILIQLMAQGHIPAPGTMLEVPVPLHQPLRFKDLPIFNVGSLDYFLEGVALTYNLRSSSAIILNTVHCLEESLLAQLRQKYQVPIFPIGPLHKFSPTSAVSLLQEDTGCIPWLDKQTHNSVIYVSLGSVAHMNQDQLSEMAWGLANSKEPFLWVIRPGTIPGSEWTESMDEEFEECVKDRGCIVKWAPQKKVLAHDAVGGFWSHCGWNSTLESICEGVPMICQPCFGDQKVNARYLTHEWMVGLDLEGEIERGAVERAVRTLMKEKEGEEMRQRVLDLKHKVDVSIGDGGSSCHYLSELAELLTSF